MGRKVKTLKNYTTEQIVELYKSNKKYYIGVKLLAMEALSRGMSSRKITEFFHVSFKQICNWADNFDKKGVEGLKMQKGRGRHSFISDEQVSHVAAVLKDSPEVVGYNTANWSGPLLKDFLNNHFHLNYSLSATYTLLHKLGFSFQRTKATFAERDEEKRSMVKKVIKKT